MNFEGVGRDEESLIRKVPRIGFFDSLSCTRESWKLPLYTSLQMVIGERIIFTILSYRLTRDILVMKFR